MNLLIDCCIESHLRKFIHQIRTFCTDMDRGESMGNGSWTGILGLLRNDQCDFVVGGFFPGNQELSI